MSSTHVPLLLETIKIIDGTIHNLSYHQKRLTKSRIKLYNSNDILDLSNSITPPKNGLYRCRIVYAKKIKSVEYIPYSPKNITTMKVVPSTIEYSLKYANRHEFEVLLRMNPKYDEVIIEHNDYITDTTISNIAFLDGERWVTPKNPLLKGTMRQKLLDDGLLEEKMIKKEDILTFKSVALINAMLGFKILNNITID